MQTHRNTHSTRLLAIVPLAALLVGACSPDAKAPSGPALLAHMQGGGGGGASSGFTVLAREAVTCTRDSIVGDVGTFRTTPPGAVTLNEGCLVPGTIDIGGPAAVAAYNAFLDQYAALQAVQCDSLLTGTLAGVTLAPGVYCFDAAAALTGTLTLNGPSNGAWIFKIGSAIATPPALPTGALAGTNFSVVLAGGAQACNVTWWVAQAATMTTSSFQGNILAGEAITMTDGNLNGNAWAGAAGGVAAGVGDVTFTRTGVVGCGASGGGQPCKVSGDRVTGGGWINWPSGAKATFAVTGGVRHGRFQGQLEYDAHGSKGKSDDFKVKGTGVTAYSVRGPVTRRIEGTAKVNGDAGFTYRVDVTDNGEPGRNDVFAITIWNKAGVSIYSASGTLRGGNIQLHKAHGSRCDKDGHDGDEDDDNGHDNGHGGHDDDH